jgi:hypothetical protein
VAGLWPLNFRVANHADLLPDGKGLRFDAPVERSMQDFGGMVYTTEPLACRPAEACAAGVLTIEIELIAANEASSCLKRIVMLRPPDGAENFYLGQWKSSLIVRAFKSTRAGGKPYNEIGVEGVLAAGRTCVATIVSGPSETAIYIDGQPTENHPGVRLLKENETLDGHKVYFGNSPDLECPWAGIIRAFAIYGKAWTLDRVVERQGLRAGGLWPCGGDPGVAVACYRFDSLKGESILDLSSSANDLRKPVHLVFEKQPFGLPAGDSFSVSDLTLNLLGFMPLGFLLCLRLLRFGRRTVKNCQIYSVAAGFAVSLLIELTQVWLPSRDSSALDLVSNTAGTAIGAFIAFSMSQKWGIHDGRR